MTRPPRHIDVKRQGDVFCVHLRQHDFDETQVQELSDDLLSLVLDDGCRKLALSLGPGSPECLYSVFLAKLFTLRRKLIEVGGAMKLCDVTPEVVGVFEACHLKEFFDFCADMPTAVADLSAQ